MTSVSIGEPAFTIDVPLAQAYTSDFVTLEATPGTLAFYAADGKLSAATDEVKIGTLRIGSQSPLISVLSIRYEYRADSRAFVFNGNDFVSSDSPVMTTFPATEREHTSSQSTYPVPNASLSFASWSHTTPLTPGLPELMMGIVRQANDAAIAAAIEAGYNVIVREQFPLITPELYRKLTVVYNGDEFLGSLDDPSVTHGPNTRVVLPESTWYGKLILQSMEAFANVIDSTNDPKINSLSWIQLWYDNFLGSGKGVTCTSLDYSDGKQQFTCLTANVTDFIGGHCVIGKIAKKMPKGSKNVFIIPICKAHNPNNNIFMSARIYQVGVSLQDYMGP